MKLPVNEDVSENDLMLDVSQRLDDASDKTVELVIIEAASESASR
jgi:hypothetical protein